MKKNLIVNGPNLNLLGVREPGIYGNDSLESINKNLEKRASELKCSVEFFHSNCEG